MNLIWTSEMSSPMPTCASKIMLTSLAPSPIARVMGCSLEALISFTICTNKTRHSHHYLSFRNVPGVYLQSEVQFSHLSFLQWCHATAEHSAAVATDLEEYIFVVARPGTLLVGLQYRRQSGPVDDQTKIEAVYWQPGTKYHWSAGSFSYKQL